MNPTHLNQLYSTSITSFTTILPRSIVCIYAHESLALAYFSWERSDLDLIVIIDASLSTDEKKDLWYSIRELSSIGPAKGIEVSFVLECYAENLYIQRPMNFTTHLILPHFHYLNF